jgi:hypothetical protein
MKGTGHLISNNLLATIILSCKRATGLWEILGADWNSQDEDDDDNIFRDYKKFSAQ